MDVLCKNIDFIKVGRKIRRVFELKYFIFNIMVFDTQKKFKSF